MGDVFQGWRRKAGCVTLLIALAFTSAWLRSLTTFEGVNYSSQFHDYSWVSYNGVIVYTDMEHLNATPAKLQEQYNWGHHQITPDDLDTYAQITDHHSGFYFGRRKDHAYLYVFQIPYSSIVVPLTLVSGVLLLSEPQKPKAIQSSNGTALCQPRLSAWEHGPSP